VPVREEAAWAQLLSGPGPAVAGPADALQLLDQLDGEADELLARALDGQRCGADPEERADLLKRRAYVWVHLARFHRALFEETAAEAVRAWQEADAEAIRSLAAPASG
jgi:hypothetical protein